MYKKASILKLRFDSTKGTLSTEQLWSLSMVELKRMLIALKEDMKEFSDDDLAFLDDTAATVDPVIQLKFDILKDVYTTIKEKRKEQLEAKSKKAELQKLLAIKAKREEAAKEEMSDDDLNKAIADLSK